MKHHRKPEEKTGVDRVRACVAIGECRPPARSKKNTKRWCGGKPGREHQWAWVVSSSLPNGHGWKVALLGRQRPSTLRERQVCLVCHRQDYGVRTRCLNCGEVAGWDSFKMTRSYRDASDVCRWYDSHERSCTNCGQIEGMNTGATRQAIGL